MFQGHPVFTTIVSPPFLIIKLISQVRESFPSSSLYYRFKQCVRWLQKKCLCTRICSRRCKRLVIQAIKAIVTWAPIRQIAPVFPCPDIIEQASLPDPISSFIAVNYLLSRNVCRHLISDKRPWQCFSVPTTSSGVYDYASITTNLSNRCLWAKNFDNLYSEVQFQCLLCTSRQQRLR